MVRFSWVILKTKEMKTFCAHCHRIIRDKLKTIGTLLQPVFSNKSFVPSDFFSSSMETRKMFYKLCIKG